MERALAAAGIAESRFYLTDYGGLPADQLEAAVEEIGGWLDAGDRTYLHCRAGWQRSAAVAAGVVAVRNGIGIDEALASFAERKPSADPLPHQREDLRRWWEWRSAPGSRPAPDPGGGPGGRSAAPDGGASGGPSGGA